MTQRPLSALLVAAASAAALVVVWFTTYQVDFTSWLDRGVQSGFLGLRHSRAELPAELVAHLVDPPAFAVLAALVTALGLARRRPRLAAAAAVILVGANVTTQLLKHLTAGPRAYELSANLRSTGELWPSGHTTAAMTLALCLVLVCPPRVRPSAATAGALFVVAIVYSILLLGWHLPSDVIGGFLVAMGWTFLTLSALRAAERRWPAPVREEPNPTPDAVLGPPLLAAVGAVGLVAVVVVLRPGQVVAHAIEHSAFMVGAPLIAAAALALTVGVSLALRR